MKIVEEIIKEAGFLVSRHYIHSKGREIGWIWSEDGDSLILAKHIIDFSGIDHELIEIHYADPQLVDKIKEFFEKYVTYEEFITHKSRMMCDR